MPPITDITRLPDEAFASTIRKYVVVSETPTSTWHYHLREVIDGRLFMGGGAPPALCGRKLGWDTEIPIWAYGRKRVQVPESWCDECWRIWTAPTATADKDTRDALRDCIMDVIDGMTVTTYAHQVAGGIVDAILANFTVALKPIDETDDNERTP